MKKSKMLCVILFVLVGLLSSCALVPPDVEVCADLVGGGAFCRTTISEREREIPVEEWPDMDATMLKITPEDVGKLLSFIEKACVQTQRCTAGEVNRLKRRISGLIEVLTEVQLDDQNR